ncbi:protein kinase [Croceicoccus sp. YJ47]|uniref:protein kinase domain-containing protein n=1 Tax=Croceicoccus sp. YJ47 TaxID=2798724 RepID=UPI0019220632|nr:protein kinase [Croceicoccus sp. YJ47]QQN74285.1 protein kinase [Croceicoccus sp. YJ47]
MRADDLFVLTSDGVHGSLSHDAIENMLREAAPRDRAEIERAASGLCDAALKAGSTDNVSCIMVRIEDLPSETLSEAYGRLTRRAIPPVLAIGNRLDDWRVVEVLHSSARSHVYLVERPDREGRYVLKAPSANFADDLRYLEGFAVEQWVGRRIRNTQVMQVLPAQDTRFFYFVAEHVEGRTLRRWMMDRPEPACDDILPLVASIVSAVRVFHRMEMVHRDLKPENIIVAEDGTAKIIDFGSVQVAGFADLQSAEIAQWPEGSLNYIAPEVLAGEAAQNLSDLFSIAAICWEMLTGTVPFDREASGKPLVSERERTTSTFARLRPDMPPAVGTVLARALSPEPGDRQQAMSEFVGELRKASRSSVRPTEFVPLIERGSKAMWRNWALIATLVSMVMAVLLFGRFG